jgi:hypothetical protein
MKEQILATKGKIFGVTFIKKDGTTRNMTARLGVRKDIKGIGLSFSPDERNLIVVFDMRKKAYRMVNLSTIISIRHESRNSRELVIS